MLVVGDDGPVDRICAALDQDGIRTLAVSMADAAKIAVACEPDAIIIGAVPAGQPIPGIYARTHDPAKAGRVPIIMLPMLDGVAHAEPTRRKGASARASSVALHELLRRVRHFVHLLTASAPQHALSFFDITMDLGAQRVYRGGRPIRLGPLEFRLLHHLLCNPGRVFSRRELLQIVWNKNAEIVSRTVDIHIGRLRRALNGEGRPNYIRTVHSRGYSLDVEE